MVLLFIQEKFPQYLEKKIKLNRLVVVKNVVLQLKDYMDFQKNDTIEAFSVTSTERSI